MTIGINTPMVMMATRENSLVPNHRVNSGTHAMGGTGRITYVKRSEYDRIFEKIMLETYVQSACFDRVLRRSNLRLMVMSGGQYELKRRRNADNQRSQSGLELAVIDHYNGTQRSIHTLSGGESFQASLSLALGLSDEIQSMAGGIRMEAMFVDEGFGSLDSEALNKAYLTLAGLTEGSRLVGIISHVEALKEKIDRQIVVKKDRTGGSSAVIVTQ